MLLPANSVCVCMRMCTSVNHEWVLILSNVFSASSLLGLCGYCFGLVASWQAEERAQMSWGGVSGARASSRWGWPPILAGPRARCLGLAAWPRDKVTGIITPASLGLAEGGRTLGLETPPPWRQTVEPCDSEPPGATLSGGLEPGCTCSHLGQGHLWASWSQGAAWSPRRAGDSEGNAGRRLPGAPVSSYLSHRA